MKIIRYVKVEISLIFFKYCEKNRVKLLFISSSNVFDYFTNFPSYENDKTFSNSVYGKVRINIENKILRMKTKNWFNC